MTATLVWVMKRPPTSWSSGPSVSQDWKAILMTMSRRQSLEIGSLPHLADLKFAVGAGGVRAQGLSLMSGVGLSSKHPVASTVIGSTQMTETTKLNGLIPVPNKLTPDKMLWLPCCGLSVERTIVVLRCMK